MPKRFDFLNDKTVLLVSHDLTLTGAPLVLMETGARMVAAGARARVVSLKGNTRRYDPDKRYGIPDIALEDSFALAGEADLVIANTAEAKTWVKEYFRRYPSGGERLLWWVHEMDTDLYGDDMQALGRAAAMVTDSRAALAAWENLEGSVPELRRAVHLYVYDDWADVDKAARLPVRNPAWRTWLHFPPPKVSREEMRDRLNVRDDELLLMIAGSITPAKGQRLLVETLGQWREEEPDLPVKLLVIGFGHEFDREQFLDQLTPGQQAVLSPERALTKVEDLRVHYLASDVFVMNSQAPGETFGRVTVEAMAFGLPVLGTDAGGTPEIVVPEETGLLFPVGQEGQTVLRRHIRRLLDDRGLMTTFGQNGKRRVRECFTEDMFVERFSAVIRQVIGNRDAPMNSARKGGSHDQQRFFGS